ncbi:MAG TPA: N utilization substance protein B, partial [Candidatus Atribacteria bacterium]|nr:N utilization substance protein B [Candidatus Atribacteria bacterium]
MTAKRTLAREAVLLSLYQIDLVNNEPEYALNTVLEELNLKEKDIIDFSNELLFSILDKIDEIDDTLESFSKR